MKKYDEIMNKIEVDAKMKKRLLSYVEHLDLQTGKTEQSPPKSKVHLFYRRNMRKITAAAACVALLFVCVFAWPQISKTKPDDVSESVSIGNGMVEVDSIEELAKAVNFPVSELKGLPFKAETVTYTSYWGEMAQIEYRGEGQTAVFRKGKGTEDVSGDYNTYPQIKEKKIGDCSVTLKGVNDRYSLAVWTDGEYSYAVALEEGMSESDWITLLRQSD